MFPEYTIDAITNGVHAGTWTSPSVQAVFDRHLPRWRQDNVTLRYAIDIPENEIVEAHAASKQALIAAVKERSGVEMRPEVFTIGFARRAATYKRADLLFTDPERLVRMAEKFGGMQMVYAGKAHPADEPGKAKIRRVIELAKELRRKPSQHRLPRKLRVEAGRTAHRRRRSVAQYSAASVRGFRNQRHEGRAQWRAEPEHSGRLVD